MADPTSGTVTLLFSDVEGSTQLLQQAGAAYPVLISEHRRLLWEAFERHGGFHVDSDGDAFFAERKGNLVSLDRVHRLARELAPA
jgi:class 3 adenylate cyclase